MTLWQRISMAAALMVGRPAHIELDEGVIKVKVNARITLRNEITGEETVTEAHNLIVSAGKTVLFDVTSPKYFKQFSYMAIGTSNTAAAVGQTAIVGTELARTSSITPTNPTSTTIKFSGSFAAGTGTGTIEECALLDAASTGNMLNRLLTGTIVKGAADSLQIDLTLSMS